MDAKEETLATHLRALRSTLIHCLVAIAVLFVPAFLAAPYCLDFLVNLIAPASVLQGAAAPLQLHYFHPMEMFVLQMKVAFVLSLLVAFPYVAHEVWVFVLPALYDSERRFVRSIVLFSSMLFVGGALFCLLVCFPMVVRFGLSFASEPFCEFLSGFEPEHFVHIVPTIGVSQVVSLALWLSVAFGVMFQFPLVTYGLVRSGIVSYESVCGKRPYVLVVVLVLAALLTPPDVVSQVVLAAPTYLLFELGLLFARRYKGR